MMLMAVDHEAAAMATEEFEQGVSGRQDLVVAAENGGVKGRVVMQKGNSNVRRPRRLEQGLQAIDPLLVEGSLAGSRTIVMVDDAIDGDDINVSVRGEYAAPVAEKGCAESMIPEREAVAEVLGDVRGVRPRATPGIDVVVPEDGDGLHDAQFPPDLQGDLPGMRHAFLVRLVCEVAWNEEQVRTERRLANSLNEGRGRVLISRHSQGPNLEVRGIWRL